MNKYGPGDPEFLGEQQPSPATQDSEVFDQFWRKVSIVVVIVTAVVLVTGLRRGWDSVHDFAVGLTIAGLAVMALGFIAGAINPFVQSETGLGGTRPFGQRVFYDASLADPNADRDPTMRRVSLLLLVAGAVAAAPGIAVQLLF